MLEDRVLYYYKEDYNCAQCMLMGARDEYGLPIECCCVDMCAGVYNGLGVGSICSIVVGGVMVISLYFKNENTIKYKRKAPLTIALIICLNIIFCYLFLINFSHYLEHIYF